MNIYFIHVGDRALLEVTGDYDDFTKYASCVYNLLSQLYKDNKYATGAALVQFLDDCFEEAKEGKK